jgi:hypothetical protein
MEDAGQKENGRRWEEGKKRGNFDKSKANLQVAELHSMSCSP